MPEVLVRKGEPVDRALKRLKNKLDSEGIMDEVRRLRAFETPTQKTKRKAKANAKRGKVKFRFNINALREATGGNRARRAAARRCRSACLPTQGGPQIPGTGGRIPEVQWLARRIGQPFFVFDRVA